MTKKLDAYQYLFLIGRYRDRLSQYFAAIRAEPKDKTGGLVACAAIGHVRWMLDHMWKTLEPHVNEEPGLDQMARWMGFVQGVLWANGVYSIDEMRMHVIEARNVEPSVETAVAR